MKRRTKARVRSVQLMYAWEISSLDWETVQENFWGDREMSDEVRGYSDRLISCVRNKVVQIDSIIKRQIVNWNISRLSIVDKNILRLGICELLYFEDIPYKVAIDEAINLAHMLGSSDSPRFVNGVLDAVSKQYSTQSSLDRKDRL